MFGFCSPLDRLRPAFHKRQTLPPANYQLPSTNSSSPSPLTFTFHTSSFFTLTSYFRSRGMGSLGKGDWFRPSANSSLIPISFSTFAFRSPHAPETHSKYILHFLRPLHSLHLCILPRSPLPPRSPFFLVRVHSWTPHHSSFLTKLPSPHFAPFARFAPFAFRSHRPLRNPKPETRNSATSLLPHSPPDPPFHLTALTCVKHS